MNVLKSYDSFCCFRSSSDGPKRVLWELTDRCNLNCPHCHVQVKKNFKDELSYDEITKILKQLKDIDVQEIIFSGGEPLLRPDIIKILQTSSSFGFEIDLCTNGSLYNEDLLNQLSHYLTEISITLDGLNPVEHELNKGKEGFFERTVKTIKYLASLSVEVHIITVVKNHNFDYLLKLPDFVGSLGAHSITFLGLMNSSVYSEDSIQKENLIAFSKSLQRLREHSKTIINTKRLFLNGPLGKCLAGKNIFGISSSGYLSPCILLPDYSEENNLRTNTVDQIVQKWDKDKIIENDVKCSSCRYQNECEKGCIGSNWLIDGKTSVDQNCWQHVY